MLRAIGGDDFQTVKPKFREQVYGMLKRDEGAPDIPEQLAEIKKGFDEYFVPAPAEPAQKMQFGAPTQGSMPKGTEGATEAFVKAWGYGATTKKE